MHRTHPQTNTGDQKASAHSSSFGGVMHNLNTITYDGGIENSAPVIEMCVVRRPAPAEA